MDSSWIARMPAGLFAIPVGLFGLAGAWQRSAVLGWPQLLPAGQSILWLTVAIWSVLLLLYSLKCLRHPHAVLQEFLHPVHGALFALLPLSILLATMLLGSPSSVWALPLVLLTIAMHGVLAVRVISIVANAAVPAEYLTAALYLPIVGGGFISGMAMATLGFPAIAGVLFGMGLAGWALLEMRLFSRLFDAPLPAPWRLTIGIELSPPTVAPLAAAIIWPDLPVELLIVGLGMIVVPVVAILVRRRWWWGEPFSFGFWSFSFPAAAIAGGMIEAVRRDGFAPPVAAAALAIASLLIGYLLLRTTVLLVGLLAGGKRLAA